MTDAMTIRKAISEYAQRHVESSVEATVKSVADELPVTQSTVRDELGTMEENGFIYCVNGEVKVT